MTGDPVVKGLTADECLLAAAAATSSRERHLATMAAIDARQLLVEPRTPTAGHHMLGGHPELPTAPLRLGQRIGLITRRSNEPEGL